MSIITCMEMELSLPCLLWNGEEYTVRGQILRVFLNFRSKFKSRHWTKIKTKNVCHAFDRIVGNISTKNFYGIALLNETFGI